MDIQAEKLCGKTVLIIGSGGVGRRNLWKTFKDLKLKVVVIHTKQEEYICDNVYRFIQYNLEDASISPDDHASNIIGILGSSTKDLAACISFEQFWLYLNALLCQRIGLRGLHPEITRIVRSKENTYSMLQKFKDTRIYSPSHFHIRNATDIQQVKEINFPAVMKPEYGAGTGGTTTIYSVDDCLEKYNSLCETHRKDWQTGNDGKSMVLMEYLDGLSYNVDIILFEGYLLKAIVSVTSKFHLVGKTIPDEFADTVTCYSSCLSGDLTEELRVAAYKCCRNVGLLSGVFNVEMKLTSNGFKLVEINGRPGCFRRCSVFKITHGIDIYVTQVLIGCGIRPIFFQAPTFHAIGCYLYSVLHKSVLSSKEFTQKINSICKDDKSISYIEDKLSLEDNKRWLAPHANIVVIDKTSVKSAVRKAIQVLKKLELTSNDYDVEKMTSFCIEQ